MKKEDRDNIRRSLRLLREVDNSLCGITSKVNGKTLWGWHCFVSARVYISKAERELEDFLNVPQ